MLRSITSRGGVLAALSSLLLLAGCAATARGRRNESRADATPRQPASEKAFTELLARAAERAGAGEYAAAEGQLDAAARMAGADPERRFQVVYGRATLAACRGEFDAAADLLLSALPAARRHPQLPHEFHIHNAVMMLREAQGDLVAALIENDEATLAGDRGRWSVPEMPRQRRVRQADLWHRAYLLRMLAETQDGSRRRATLGYAEAARAAYAELARPHRFLADSVAVLDGFFAVLDGRREDALAAARRVQIESNGDLEDLYLTAVAFAAAGDLASARRVHDKIRAAPVYLARPIMLGWLERADGFAPVRPAQRTAGR